MSILQSKHLNGWPLFYWIVAVNSLAVIGYMPTQDLTVQLDRENDIHPRKLERALKLQPGIPHANIDRELLEVEAFGWFPELIGTADRALSRLWPVTVEQYLRADIANVLDLDSTDDMLDAIELIKKTFDPGPVTDDDERHLEAARP